MAVAIVIVVLKRIVDTSSVFIVVVVLTHPEDLVGREKAFAASSRCRPRYVYTWSVTVATDHGIPLHNTIRIFYTTSYAHDTGTQEKVGKAWTAKENMDTKVQVDKRVPKKKELKRSVPRIFDLKWDRERPRV